MELYWYLGRALRACWKYMREVSCNLRACMVRMNRIVQAREAIQKNIGEKKITMRILVFMTTNRSFLTNCLLIFDITPW